MKAILHAIPRNPVEENKFLSDIRFFPGRRYEPQTRKVFQPQESLLIYEKILAQIKRIDPDRYSTMHKGTPFYIMGWLAYEMRDYEKGVFYMDAALSEDVHNAPTDWKTLPAAAFLFLDDTNMNAAARTITIEAKKEVETHVKRFARESGEKLNMGSLIDEFFKPHAEVYTYRSIITSLLTFLLESKDLRLQLDIRSSYGGSLEPFLTHLFKGGLIFESLLKRNYSSAGNTLGKYLEVSKADLELKIEVYKRHLPYELEKFPLLLRQWQTENFQERAVAIAYGVRNTSGHDLGWQDIFSGNIFNELFEGIVNAIFWTIKKAYKV
jgi:hypothetical protein